MGCVFNWLMISLPGISSTPLMIRTVVLSTSRQLFQLRRLDVFCASVGLICRILTSMYCSWKVSNIPFFSNYLMNGLFCEVFFLRIFSWGWGKNLGNFQFLDQFSSLVVMMYGKSSFKLTSCLFFLLDWSY